VEGLDVVGEAHFVEKLSFAGDLVAGCICWSIIDFI